MRREGCDELGEGGEGEDGRREERKVEGGGKGEEQEKKEQEKEKEKEINGKVGEG
jgi:hypothetical protein